MGVQILRDLLKNLIILRYVSGGSVCYDELVAYVLLKYSSQQVC